MKTKLLYESVYGLFQEDPVLAEAVSRSYELLFEHELKEETHSGWKGLNSPYNSIQLPDPDAWYSPPTRDGPGLRAHYAPGRFTYDDMLNVVVPELRKHLGSFGDELGADEIPSTEEFYTHDEQGTWVRMNKDGSVDLGLPIVLFTNTVNKAFFPTMDKNGKTQSFGVKAVTAFGDWGTMKDRIKSRMK